MYFSVLLNWIRIRRHHLLICLNPKKKSLVEIQDCCKEQIESLIRHSQFDTCSTNIGRRKNTATKVSMDIKSTIMPDQSYEFSVFNDLLDDYGLPWNELSYSSGKVNGIRYSSELCRKMLKPLIRHDPNCSDEFDPYVIVILSQLWKYSIHPIEAVFDYFGWWLTIKSYSILISIITASRFNQKQYCRHSKLALLLLFA